MLKIRDLPEFEGVGASSKARMNLTNYQGQTYNGIMLVMGGTAFNASHMTAIKVKLAGKPVVDISGADLLAINKYYGYTNAATHLFIPFADAFADHTGDIDGFDIGGIDTSVGYASFIVEIDIGAATAPTLKAYGHLSKAQPRLANYKGMFRSLLTIERDVGALGTYDLAKDLLFGGDSGGFLRAIHVAHANITDLEFLQDSVPQIDPISVTDYQQFVTQQGTRAVQAGYLSIDPLVLDNAKKAIFTLRPVDPDNPESNLVLSAFRLNLTYSAADTVRGIVDKYCTLEAI